MDLGALVESANACCRALNEFFKSFTIPKVTCNFWHTWPTSCPVMSPARLAPGRARVLIPKDDLTDGARLGAGNTDATGLCFGIKGIVVENMDPLEENQSVTLDDMIREVQGKVEGNGTVAGKGGKGGKDQRGKGK